MPANSKIDYYEALFEKAGRRLQIGDGEELVLRRAGLGRHFYLQTLRRRLEEAKLDCRVDVLKEWLVVAGVTHPEKLSLSDLLHVVRAVVELNAPRGQPAWSFVSSDGQPSHTRLSDYTGRTLARVVHTLASHYGWHLEEVLELPPELALAHLQECILADRKRREWEHLLSEMSWEYDKGSGKSRYKPLPELPWDAVEERVYTPLPAKIIEKYYPKGVIVDLTKRSTESLGRSEGASADNETS